MRRRWASIRPGSANTISPCSPARIWCWPMSRPAPGAFGTRSSGAAAAPSDPRRRAVGDPRPDERRARRFCRRPRLRPARVPAVEGLLRRQPGYLRGRNGGRPAPVVKQRTDLAPRRALSVDDVSITRSRCSARSPLCRLVLAALDRACCAPGLRAHRRTVRCMAGCAR